MLSYMDCSHYTPSKSILLYFCPRSLSTPLSKYKEAFYRLLKTSLLHKIQFNPEVNALLQNFLLRDEYVSSMKTNQKHVSFRAVKKSMYRCHHVKKGAPYLEMMLPPGKHITKRTGMKLLPRAYCHIQRSSQ